MLVQRRARWMLWAVAASTAAAVVSVGLGGPTLAGVPPAGATLEPGVYLVTLRDTPVASYRGDVRGYAATRPAAGRRFDNARPEVRRYRDYLRARQDEVLDRAGSPHVLYRYTTVVSGLAVELDTRQVKQLRDLRAVRSVERSTISRLDSVDSPDFLGLTGASGTWADAGGAAQAGKDVVIGFVDSGLWPESPSFTGPPAGDGGINADLPGFTGRCQEGERWRADTCDQKVVAARWFVDGFGADSVASAEYLSARDAQGHGSHVASTAAGNHAVRVEVGGAKLGTSSGMAPGARVATYKACWAAPDPDHDGCASADTVKAVDQAVADGVDVLSYPLSGPAASGRTMRQAFRGAADAGVFVVTSAGNAAGSGVTPSSPFVTTVGASSFRLLEGAAVLGNGTRLVGAMVSERALPTTPLVRGRKAPARDADSGAAARCEPRSLDAAAVAGKAVVCERGGNARVDKSRAVKQAGGAAMLLVNPKPGAVAADFHAVPTVHLDTRNGRRVRAYLRIAGSAATVSFDPAASDPAHTPPRMASFSGHSPATGRVDVLKPDLTAPGVSVVAAVAPPTDSGRLWDAMSGTSMAAAHVAGLAAVVRDVHPGWSPTAVRSAMMTTAYDVRRPRSAWNQGAGHVDPERFLDPGLVFDAQPPAGRVRPFAVNTPSIAVNRLAGGSVARRTVTNVSTRTETYNASVRGLAGLSVSVVPATLRLRPGQSADFRVRFVAKKNARFERFVTGHVTWHGNRGHAARVPVVARAVRVVAPREVRGIGNTGTVRLAGKGGMRGRIGVRAYGLVGAEPQRLALSPGDFDRRDPEPGPSTKRSTYTVPAGTAALRFAVNAYAEGADFDLYVYRDGRLVSSETGVDGSETVTLLSPEPGEYEVYTHAQRSAGRAVASARFTGWVVPRRDTGTLELSTRRAQLLGAREFAVRASWTRLDTSLRWFGVVQFGDASDGALTPVSVD